MLLNFFSTQVNYKVFRFRKKLEQTFRKERKFPFFLLRSNELNISTTTNFPTEHHSWLFFLLLLADELTKQKQKKEKNLKRPKRRHKKLPGALAKVFFFQARSCPSSYNYQMHLKGFKMTSIARIRVSNREKLVALRKNWHFVYDYL